MRTHDLAFCSRPKLLGQHKLFYNGLDVAFAPYGHSWREMRKICVVHLLSSKRVQSFRPVREEEVFSMTRELSRDSGRVVNLTAVMLGLTSTLICRIAFGKGNSKRERFDELMIEAQAMQAGFAFVSDYFPWLGWVDRLRGMVARLEKIYRDMDDFVEQLICEHLDPSWPHFMNPNILDLLIQLKNENSCSITLTWDHVKAILMVTIHSFYIDILGTDFEVIPFGAGRRGCPGIAMGLATVELTLANLLHSFDWEFPPGVYKEDIDTQVLPGLTMHKKHPLCLVPINRTQHGA
ncbi:hypothetical protein SASPL_148644 [Salvia splendens]|uniref:Uncharacterized protein n=1 Tax=Salvia splendens TaxID=180675 RepID=A0A8X8Z4H0_SALSN|nr:hypothetical protein SASPL_148644 [Salvia splendens]